VTEILKGRRSITGDTALRFGHFFGMSREFWMNLQKLYDLRLAESKSGETIKDLPTLARMKKNCVGIRDRKLYCNTPCNPKNS
jgi:antitoxin HigA-1